MNDNTVSPVGWKTIDQPKTLATISNTGEVTIFWDEIEIKAKENVPGLYNDVNTSWAYILMSMRGRNED